MRPRVTAAAVRTGPSGSKTNGAHVQQDSNVPVSRSLSDRGSAGSRLGGGGWYRAWLPWVGGWTQGPCVLHTSWRLAHIGGAHSGGNRESQQALSILFPASHTAHVIGPSVPTMTRGWPAQAAQHRGEDQEACGLGSVKFCDDREDRFGKDMPPL